MNVNYVEKQIKKLRYINISHIIIIIVSIFLFIIGIKNMYFTSKLLYIILKYSIIFRIIFITIPIALIIIIPLYRKEIKVIKFLKILTMTFIIISFIIGLLINILIWKTSVKAETFIKYCPYHFTNSLINKIIDKSLNESNNIKDNLIKFCNIRKCILFSEIDSDPLAYSYICNYDSSQDFRFENDNITYKRNNLDNIELLSNKYIKCFKLKNILFNKTLVNYLTLCNNNSFYKCNLFEKPKEQDMYSFNNIESCPQNNYSQNAFLLSILLFFTDIIFFCFLFFFEHLILINIEYLIKFSQTVNQIKDNQSTINSTINNNQQNSNNNEEEFKKEKTKTIIIGGKRTNKIDNLFIKNKINENIIKTSKKDEMTNIQQTSHYNNKNQNNINENKKNKKNRFENQEISSQSVDTSSIFIKSQIDKYNSQSRIYLNTIDILENQDSKDIKEKNKDKDESKYQDDT